MDTKFIENLFFRQIKALTLKSCETYDYQFSDAWINNNHAGGEKIW
ncbi:MAG: hypothetical protein AB7V77_04440 [Candidatus Woesearchaeota archaeon]